MIVFHGGTREVDGAIFADGGRVLAITALGSNIAEAQRRAYEAVRCIYFPGMFYRRDIGDKALSNATSVEPRPSGSEADAP